MALIIGNWKMNGTVAQAEPLVKAVVAHQASKPDGGHRVVLCPPAQLLSLVGGWLQDTGIRLGAQDCHTEVTGAYTGDISASMLKDIGCRYVILGHSERRAYHKESSELVARKAAAAIQAGLIPIICVGEQWEERSQGRAESTVTTQLIESLPEGAGSHEIIIAYEPVWAIGSGKTPTSEDIDAMHRHIENVVRERIHWKKDRPGIIYGGSVKDGNAEEILSIASVGGVLVGGASLDAGAFCRIIMAGIGTKVVG